jgi:hypothetical protein
MIRKGLVFIVVMLPAVPVCGYVVEDFESASGMWGGWFAGYYAGGEGALTSEFKLPGWKGTSGWRGDVVPYNWGFDGMFYNTWETPFWNSIPPASGRFAAGLGNSGRVNVRQEMYKRFTVVPGGFEIKYARRYVLKGKSDVNIRLYDTASPFIITIERISTTYGTSSTWKINNVAVPGIFYKGSELDFKIEWRQGNYGSGYSYFLVDDIEVNTKRVKIISEPSSLLLVITGLYMMRRIYSKK